MMKLIKRWMAMFISFVLVSGFFVGNMQMVQTKANEEKLTLNYTSVAMQKGAKLALRMTPVSQAGASKKTIWESSKKKVVSVSRKGVITAKKKGTATITAKVKSTGKTVKCKVNVTDQKKAASDVLVAYFSATGTTKSIAKKVAKAAGGTLYQITPAEKYSSKDLDYNNDNSRANKEQNNAEARPSLNGKTVNMQDFGIVFIAYPVWHGQAPRVISTFLESYSFSGKTVIPFCTSHSSGIGSSADTLKESCKGNVTWKSGRRFAGDEPQPEITKWVDSLGIKKNGNAPQVASFPLSEGKNGKAPVITLNSGYKMPVLGLGTYSLEGEVCASSVMAALKAGVRKIDTAYIYDNEESVGEGIRKSGVPREEIFVTTKLYMNQYDNAGQAIDDALERLGLEYIDLMLLHHLDDNDVKAYKAMEKAVRQGKIRSIGLSNYYIKEMKEFLPKTSITPALVQNEIHPFYQEKKVVEYMHKQGIAVEAWYPLGGRGYTGKLLNNKTILDIAKAHNVSSAQVILRWHLQRGVVAIPGSSNPSHIKENISVFGFNLSKKEMNQIAGLDRNEKHDWY